MLSCSSLPLLCALQLLDAFETVEQWVARQRAQGDSSLLLIRKLDVRLVPHA